MPGLRRSGFRVSALACAAAVVVLVLVLALGGSSGSASPDLLRSAGGNLTASEDNAAGGAALTIGRGRSISMLVDDPLCAVGSPVTIDAVTLHDRHSGLVLRRWGIANHHTMLGDADGPLSGLGPFTGRRVYVTCSKHGPRAELGVELARSSAASGRTLGIDVHYRSGHEEKTLWLGEVFALCTSRDGRAALHDSDFGHSQNLCSSDYDPNA